MNLCDVIYGAQAGHGLWAKNLRPIRGGGNKCVLNQHALNAELRAQTRIQAILP